MKMHREKHNEGMALLAALFFAAIAVLILTALSARTLGERTHVMQFTILKNCFEGLESAYAQSKADVEAGGSGLIGMDASAVPDEVGPENLPTFDSPGVNPVSMPSMPDVEFFAFALDWANDNLDNNGDNMTDDTGEEDMYSVYSFARSAGVVRRSEVIMRASNISVWNNAIFAGSGQAGGLINGNVEIHGGVHLLGENVIPGTEVITALDLIGASLIHNNYIGLEAHLDDRVPPLRQTLFGGEIVDTLEANLRVRHGLVGLSGAAEVGEPDQPGNSTKETMDGCYVNDGWTGNNTADDGGKGDPNCVYSDNGWDEDYDLGNKVPFPVFEDEWRDPITGEKVWDSSRNEWYTHIHYFEEVLVADPNDPNDGMYEGDIDLDTDGASFYWNATTNEELVGALPAVPPGPDDDYLLFVPDGKNGATLTINGQIAMNGNLDIHGKNLTNTVYYSGRSAILVHGDVTLEAHLITCNGGDKTNVTNSYPQNNCLGLMAEHNLYVGMTAQLDIMGAIYGLETIQTAKQTTMMGTFVSNYFDMGGQVPDIYQVPVLVNNLPMGMIANYPVLNFSRVSWRELDNAVVAVN